MKKNKGLNTGARERRGRTVRSVAAEPYPEQMRYFGVLGLLCECAVWAPDDLRDQIDQALADACQANPHLKYRRILNRREIEVSQ